MDGHVHHVGGTRCAVAVQERTAARAGATLHLAEERCPIRVLILEDDPDLAFALSLLLSLDDGFMVEVVYDVATCLERLRARTALLNRGQVPLTTPTTPTTCCSSTWC